MPSWEEPDRCRKLGAELRLCLCGATNEPNKKSTMFLLRCALLAAVTCSGCGHGPPGRLSVAVESYLNGLRWKRFHHSAAYVPADRQAEFLERYLAAEDDLHIESAEIRGVVLQPDEEFPTARVIVMAQAYLLPSMVLEKVIMVQTWQQRDGAWRLIETSRELAPALAGAASAG